MLDKMRDLAIAVATVFFAATTCAMAQTPTAPADATTPPPAAPAGAPLSSSAPLVSDPEYRLGDGDIVDVMVVGSGDFNTRGRVSADGALLLPLIGAIPARGETPAGLAAKVADALKKGNFYQSPVVRVELAGIRSRYVTVLGSVSSAGLLPLDRSYRLSEIIARVGKSPAGASYVILTPASGEPRRYSIADIATKGGLDDPVVQSGDKIYVPPADDELFYMTGEVKKPGPAILTPNLTIRVALAMSGGVTENGSEKKITLVRKGTKLKGVNLETKVF